MARLTRTAACEILSRAGVPRGADYHTLSSTQVDNLLVQARRAKYRKSKGAPGSKGRMFHKYVERSCR